MRHSTSAMLKQEAAAAQEMLRSGLSEWDKVNGLERPYVPASDAVPDRWTLEHLQRRMIDAMKTQEKLPAPRGPRGVGNNWMETCANDSENWAISVDWESLSYTEKQERHAELNFVADRPTMRAITEMEKCQAWLKELRQAHSGWGLYLAQWSIYKARNRPISDLCRKEGWSFSSFYKGVREASEFLSNRLNARLEAVF